MTLVLTKDVLITIRYEQLKAFTIFAQRCAHAPVNDGGEAALELLDAIVERCAEVLEHQSNLVHETSTAVFNRPPSNAFGPLLSDLARAQSITSMARQEPWCP